MCGLLPIDPKKSTSPRSGWVWVWVCVKQKHYIGSTSELRCVVAAPQQLLPIELRLKCFTYDDDNE